jgi:hypothetical protein
VTVPLARTNDEAHLYMELRPCVCGETDFDATSSVTQVGGSWISRYAGRCTECGRERVFEFRQPDEITVPTDGAWAPGAQPSELLDAGEWLVVADAYGSTDADPAGLSTTAQEQVRTDLAAAAAALDEVLKFLPAGADQVPESAFWSAQGRAVRDAEPGRFRRARIEAARQVYRTALAAFPDPRPAPDPD